MIIEIKNIDGILPSDFTDQIITEDNPIPIGLYEEEWRTSNKYGTIKDPIEREQRIQALLYDRYRLQFVTQSTYNLQLMKYGDVTVTFNEGFSQHKAIVTDVQTNLISGNWWSVVVEYYDNNPVNYLGEVVPVTNYLRSDFVKEKYDWGQLYVLQFLDQPVGPFQGVAKEFYTAITPKLNTTFPDGDTFTVRGQDVRPNSTVKKVYDLVFFLTAEDRADLKYWAGIAGGWKVTAKLLLGNQQFQLKDLLEVQDDNLGGYDLHQITIPYIYEVVDHFEYA